MTREAIMIGDFGKDLDDENALLYTVGAQQAGEVTLTGVVANLKDQALRARLAKGTLDALGIDIPVSVGTSCNVNDKTFPYETDVPYLATTEVPVSGTRLLVDQLEDASDKSITLILNSGLTDASQLFLESPKLVTKKVERVAIMGGVQVEAEKVALDSRGMMSPDSAANNMFDKRAADTVYEWLQENQIPMTVVTKEAAYACKFDFKLYNDMAATGHVVGQTLLHRQQPSLEGLWKGVNAEIGSDERGSLPERCNRSWFINTFLDGQEPGNSDIWEQASRVGTFQLYDSLNTAAIVRPEYFDPVQIVVKGVSHDIVGVSKNQNGIADADGLRSHITTRELQALTLEKQPTAR